MVSNRRLCKYFNSVNGFGNLFLHCYILESVDTLILYFYIACGVAGLLFFLLFIFIGVLFLKVNQLAADGSNQLHCQRDMMSEFCYTNPMIVPGEELSRRGFSMYRGSNLMSMQAPSPVKNNDYTIFNESRSKF